MAIPSMDYFKIGQDKLLVMSEQYAKALSLTALARQKGYCIEEPRESEDNKLLVLEEF